MSQIVLRTKHPDMLLLYLSFGMTHPQSESLDMFVPSVAENVPTAKRAKKSGATRRPTRGDVSTKAVDQEVLEELQEAADIPVLTDNAASSEALVEKDCPEAMAARRRSRGGSLQH